MIRSIIIFCIFFIVSSPNVVVSEPVIVKSKTLSIKDIESYLSSVYLQHKYQTGKLVKVYGIYQNGNSAEIFYAVHWKKTHVYGNDGKQDTSINIKRLNSGKWFDSNKFLYVTK